MAFAGCQASQNRNTSKCNSKFATVWRKVKQKRIKKQKKKDIGID